MNMPSLRCNFKLTICCSLLFLIAGASAGCQSSSQNTAASPAASPSVSTTPAASTAPPATPAASTALANPEASPSGVSSLPADAPVIVAFGDSLTAGFGLPESESYPSRLQRLILERGYKYRVVNSGVSGDTSAGGVRRIDWALKGNVKILILELGGNDALRGQPPSEMKKNLAAIIERTKRGGVQVILAGMEAPPNLGPDYTREFRQVFRDLAREHNTPLISFFLERVGGIAELNQADGIHPNTKGVEIVVENVWRTLEPLLRKE